MITTTTTTNDLYTITTMTTGETARVTFTDLETGAVAADLTVARATCDSVYITVHAAATSAASVSEWAWEAFDEAGIEAEAVYLGTGERWAHTVQLFR